MSLRFGPILPASHSHPRQKITNMMDPADIPEELSEELERLPRVASSHHWVYRLKDCVRWLGGYGRYNPEGTTPPAVSATREGVGPPGSPETGAHFCLPALQSSLCHSSGPALPCHVQIIIPHWGTNYSYVQ